MQTSQYDDDIALTSC